MDLHEALLTRGDVQGNQEYSWLIFHPCNCVLVHANCHKPGKGGNRIFKNCAWQLVKYEGKDRVIDFLTAMKQHYPQEALFALRRFESLRLK